MKLLPVSDFWDWNELLAISAVVADQIDCPFSVSEVSCTLGGLPE